MQGPKNIIKFMKRNIVIERMEAEPIEEREIEIVERKGVGHPDTLCDLCAELSSEFLSQYYLKRFSTIFHHNLDKGLLVAGSSKPRFGGGKVLSPIKITIGGRATDRVGKIKIPVEKILKKKIESALAQILNLKLALIRRYFRIFIDYNPGAVNLLEVFKRTTKVGIANDTSFGVSHGPFSKTELVTLRVANLLNYYLPCRDFPFLGKDIKVMSLRKGDALYLTFSCAYIDRYFSNIKEYFKAKERVKQEVFGFIKRNFRFKEVIINHNTLDADSAKSPEEVYLTVLGLSSEHGDDGQVGRGNRVCGLITPCREMSLEAAAGKNINHPGKLYQILAHLIAQKIGKIEGVKECSVRLLSQIGKPLDQPQMASVKIISKRFNLIKDEAFEIVNNVLSHIPRIQKEIVMGKYKLF